MNPLTAALERHTVLILDGALATELEQRGCDLNDPLWSARVLIEQPELIEQVHADYFAAGADIAITASYQASFAGFAARGINDEAATALLQRSVELARRARDRFVAAGLPADRPQPLVAASIGPYGAYLHDGSEYRGDYRLSEDELIAWHRPRLAALAAAGPDLLACETIPTLREARALARLLSEFPQLSAWISFTARDGLHTSRGEPIAACAAELADFPQIAALGINCSAPRHLPSLIAQIRGACNLPVVVYPNSGEAWDAANHCWFGSSDSGDFAALACSWQQAGAQLIGGCCRTGPQHIRALAAALR